MPERSRLPRFRELDGIRGFAALGVFIHHFTKSSADHPALNTPYLNKLFSVLTLGGFGVDAFFVLSGFLITGLLLIDRNKPNYFHNFYWKRALRILPVYFIYLFLTFVIIGHSWGYVLLALLFLVNFANRFNVVSNGVAWSLSIEEQFYLVWPHCVRRLNVTSLYYLALCVFGICNILRFVAALRSGGAPIAYTFYRCDGLGLGALLACQWFSDEGRTAFIRGALRVLNSKITLVFVIVAQIAITVLPASPVGHMATLTFVNYLAYRFIRHIVLRSDERTEESWLGSAVPVFIGSISYGIYMYHGFVLILFDRYLGPIDPASHLATLGRFVVSLAITLFVCFVSSRYIEIPIQGLRRRVLRP